MTQTPLAPQQYAISIYWTLQLESICSVKTDKNVIEKTFCFDLIVNNISDYKRNDL